MLETVRSLSHAESDADCRPSYFPLRMKEMQQAAILLETGILTKKPAKRTTGGSKRTLRDPFLEKHVLPAIRHMINVHVHN